MRSRKYFYYFDGNFPQDVANMGYNVWNWDAQESVMWQEVGKSNRVTNNGDPVAVWTDTVSGVDAIQATTANKPTYTTASLNGAPTLAFDGGDILATANISISTFAVWVVTTNVTTKALTFEHGVNAFSNDGMNWINNDFRVTRSSSTAISNLTYVTPSVFRGEFNGAPRQYLNNTLTGTLGATIPTTSANAPLFIGARSGVAFPMTGNIAELVIVSPYPTAAIIANMESYINQKWSIY